MTYGSGPAKSRYVDEDDDDEECNVQRPLEGYGSGTGFITARYGVSNNLTPRQSNYLRRLHEHEDEVVYASERLEELEAEAERSRFLSNFAAAAALSMRR